MSFFAQKKLQDRARVFRRRMEHPSDPFPSKSNKRSRSLSPSSSDPNDPVQENKELLEDDEEFTFGPGLSYLAQMDLIICTVLEHEAHLFNDTDLDIIAGFQSLSGAYESRFTKD